MIGWTLGRALLFFSCSLSLPPNVQYKKIGRLMIVNAFKFRIILIKIFFPTVQSRFAMRRNHHCSSNIFSPSFSSKHWIRSSVTLSRRVLSYHRWEMGKAKKFRTPLYISPLPSSREKQFTNKSFRFDITAALVSCFAKVLIYSTAFLFSRFTRFASMNRSIL